MAQLLLIPLGNAIGAAAGGALAASIGGAIGAVAGNYINGLFTPPTRTEGPRLKTQEITAAGEGSPMNRLWGRSRMSGNIIWSTRFEEEVIERKSGGKGGPKNINTEYSYFMNFAVALCEGPVTRIGRLWAAGKEIDQEKYVIRKYFGDETQMPDELIVAKEGSAHAPAFRGTAYIVFERLPVDEFGQQPQITAEVYRSVGELEPGITSIAFHPDAGEFGFDTLEQTQNEEGEALPENRHVLTAETDFLASLDELKAIAPNLGRATLHPQWFANDTRCGQTDIRPAVRDKANTVSWGCHTLVRDDAATITRLFDQPLFGGTTDDAALARAAIEMGDQGIGVTLSPKLTLDPGAERFWTIVAADDYVIAWSPELRLFTGLDAAGSGGTSRDGISWASHPIAVRNWKSVCWSASTSRFVAVGDDASGTTIATSPDGVVWTEASTIAGSWRAVEWVDDLGLFVVVGTAAPHAMWSSDGVSWTAGTAPARSWFCLKYAPKLQKFVALDSASKTMMQSSDGKNWNEYVANLGGTGSFQGGLAWSEELGLFASIGQFIANRHIYVSSDGIDWVHSGQSVGFSASTSVVAGAGGILATGNSGEQIKFTDDGSNFRSIDAGVGTPTGRVATWVPELARFIISTGGGFGVSNPNYKPSLKHLSCDPAWDAAGTPDAGNNALELAAQVDTFFGTAVASDISLSLASLAESSSTNYSGPDEWGYRRFILHYAQLAAAINAEAPGTITSFLLGDGMSGMTRLRASDNPEVQPDYLTTVALLDLLTEVRGILGVAVNIGYAADPVEFAPLQLSAGRIGYPLDTLWGNSDIDFVGLNASFPLTDWRDGYNHLDAAAGIASIYDPAYLAAGVAGGELYDWTYADQAARDSQSRTPIADVGPGKPWVWRQKDLLNWWNRSHYARTADGVEHGTATPWTAEVKPIRFTSLLCPAIDKGSNEPAARYDPASKDHKRVYYSSGARDDAIQRAVLDAVRAYWSEPANNPVSIGYGNGMVDLDAMTLGWWDARPASTFPMDGRYWADADNHEYGAWLTGRLGSADATGTLKTICEDYGFTAYVIQGLGAAVDGITAQGGNSGRSVIESIQPALLFDVVETPGALRFQSRGGARIVVNEGQLVQGDGEPWQITRAQETDLPASIEMTYGEISTDDQSAIAKALHGVTASDRTQTIGLPVVMGASRARALADIALGEIWMGRETMETALPPSLLKAEAGDVITLGSLRGFWRVISITDGLARTATLSRYDPRIYNPPRFPRRAKYPVGSSKAGARGSAQATPIPFFMDLPLLLEGQNPDAGYFAAYMRPIGNGIALYRSPAADDYTLDQVISLPAITGVTTASLPKGPVWTWDNASALDVKLNAGELAAASDLSVLNGANAMALQQPSGEWEILQFANVEITGTRKYRLTRLLRGQRGSEHAIGDPLPSGARFVLLDAGVVQTNLPSSSVGLPRSWRVGPASAAVSDALFSETEFTYKAKARRPYAPVHLKAAAASADIDISWMRRSRIGYGAWNQATVPLGEDSEAYEIDIMDGASVVRTATSSTTAVTYTEANQITDFGSAQSNLTFNVYQLSAQFGRGIAGTYSGAVS